MLLAKSLRQNPRAIAEALLRALPASDFVVKAEIAGAGFINFFLTPAAKQAVVRDILQQPAAWSQGLIIWSSGFVTLARRLRLSPERRRQWALWTSLSRMASARIGSPMASSL